MVNLFSAKIWQGCAKWWQRLDYFWLYTLQSYEKTNEKPNLFELF